MARALRPLSHNSGIESAYRKELAGLVEEMANSYQYWIRSAYRKFPPRMSELAMDAASPAAQMKKVMGELSKRWIDRLETMAPIIADKYIKDLYKASDSAFRAELKKAGIAVEFKMTPAVRDALTAQIQNNVALIKSIPQEYHKKVENSVMSAYMAGRDLATMTESLTELYPEAKRRVAFIALDQSNKANAICNQARAMELGIDEAEWHHSHAGKTPRPSHVKAGRDKLRFKIKEGAYIDGKYIQPGEEPGCRCTSRMILPF